MSLFPLVIMRISVPAVPSSSDPERARVPSWRAFSASGIGLEMGLYVLLGFLAGRWLDGVLGTQPMMLITMVIIGVVIGTISLIRTSRTAWGVRGWGITPASKVAAGASKPATEEVAES